MWRGPRGCVVVVLLDVIMGFLKMHNTQMDEHAHWSCKAGVSNGFMSPTTPCTLANGRFGYLIRDKSSSVCFVLICLIYYYASLTEIVPKGLRSLKYPCSILHSDLHLKIKRLLCDHSCGVSTSCHRPDQS